MGVQGDPILFPTVEKPPAQKPDELLDVHRVRAEQLRLVDSWKARGRSDAVKYGPELFERDVPIGDEIEAIVEKRLHHLGAAREAVLIESAAFLHSAPALQESAQRRVAAAEAALKAAGIPAEMVALDPAPERARPAGLLRRLASWLMEPDDEDESRLEALRRTRKAAVGDLREAEREILQAHVRQQNAETTSIHLMNSERALAKELWAAYQDGVHTGLPVGAGDTGGTLRCGEPPRVEVPGWAAAGGHR